MEHARTCIAHVGSAVAILDGQFGVGNRLILLDSVNCVGNETYLLHCRAQELGTHNCQPTEDSAVFCPCEWCHGNTHITT